MINFEKSCIVVAHPDDEIIFLGSVIDKVNHTFISFLPYNNNKKTEFKLMYEYPLIENVEFLLVDQSFCWGDVNWKTTAIIKHGVHLKSGFQNLKYYKNYYTLYNILKPKLKDYKTVFTHNPWGETEHAEHIQVFQIVKELQQLYNYEIYYSNYICMLDEEHTSFADKVIKERNIKSYPVKLKIPVNKCLRIKKEYQKLNSWTGHPNHNWSQLYDILYQDKNIEGIEEKMVYV